MFTQTTAVVLTARLVRGTKMAENYGQQQVPQSIAPSVRYEISEKDQNTFLTGLLDRNESSVVSDCPFLKTSQPSPKANTPITDKPSSMDTDPSENMTHANLASSPLACHRCISQCHLSAPAPVNQHEDDHESTAIELHYLNRLAHNLQPTQDSAHRTSECRCSSPMSCARHERSWTAAITGRGVMPT